MPSVAVKLYSVYFKLVLKHKLQSQIQTLSNQSQSQSQSPKSQSQFGITSRPDEPTAPANPSFSGEGVATKDIHIDPLTSLSVRIFLPDTSISNLNLNLNHSNEVKKSNQTPRRCSYSGGGSDGGGSTPRTPFSPRRSSYDGGQPYRGYLPSPADRSQFRKIPVMLQFHGGAFVSGSNVSVANDFFCRRISKLLDVIVIAVGYRLAPECRYPAAFEDGMKVLHWLGKQANLAECSKSLDGRRSELNLRIVDAFGASTVEPWLAAHGDPSR